LASECNKVGHLDRGCTQDNTSEAADMGPEQPEARDRYPRGGVDWWTPRRGAGQLVLGAGNCSQSLLRNQSQPSVVGSAEPAQCSVDLHWTSGLSTALGCNTGEGEECSACDSRGEAALCRICGNTSQGGSSG
jgi:hypothetical protein